MGNHLPPSEAPLKGAPSPCSCSTCVSMLLSGSGFTRHLVMMLQGKGIGDKVAKWMVALYIDDGLVASRDPVWLQSSFDMLVGLFERIGLFTNDAKAKVIT